MCVGRENILKPALARRRHNSATQIESEQQCERNRGAETDVCGCVDASVGEP